MPIPNTDPMRITTEMTISYHGTVLIAMRVNIAIGEVNGIYEHRIIHILSTFPLVMEKITTMKATINSIVIGMTEVLMSSSFDAVDPTAPYINA